jgi:hypothetical protein
MSLVADIRSYWKLDVSLPLVRDVNEGGTFCLVVVF